jgi:YHS domain-containing protein
LIRFVIIAITSYLGFKLVQKIAARFLGREVTGASPKPEVSAEELVQDPVCKVFVPRRNALKAHKNGEDYFFCSEGCRLKFLKTP